MENVKVSVVIPARNEAPTIRNIIREAKNYASEVLVIDGNSQDDTRKIAEEEGAKVFQDAGKGKGIAVRLAIEKVQGDIIVFIDADGSHDRYGQMVQQRHRQGKWDSCPGIWCRRHVDSPAGKFD